MAKHRGVKRRSKKIAALGAATVTATALAVGAGPTPTAAAAATRSTDPVDLTADFRLFPPPQAIPDLTYGAGKAAYDFRNEVADRLFRSFFEDVNLAAVARRLGVDPQSLVERVLANLPLALLTDPIFGIVGNLPLPLGNLVRDLPVVGNILANLLANGLNRAGIDTIGEVLGILGLDLSDPFNLSGVDRLGVNVVTSGDVFTLFKVLGVDLGWTPTLPNSVADDVNGTDYLGAGVDGLLDALGTPVASIVTVLNQLLSALGLGSTDDIPDLLKVRAPIVVGAGVGAFAAGMAYHDIVAQLPFQPGGTQYHGPEAPPLLGSLTLMPMLLLQNPGRANGGLFARMYPLAGLFGIDTVTPDTQVGNSGGLALGGLYVGGATLVPVKIDVTVQHDWLSDFAAWPNPFSLANSLAAALAPTYILRGIDAGLIAGDVAEQLGPQLGEAVGNPVDGEPLGLNFYLTIPINALPLLEPTYLMVDAINLLTGANLNNPIGTALAPALSSLINLGYTDVERQWNADSGYWQYVRTFDDTGVPTAFGSFPDLDWAKVPGDIFAALGAGVRQAFEDGLVNRDGPVKNVLATVLNLLGLDGGLPGGIGGLGLDGVFDQIRDTIDGALGDLNLVRANTSAVKPLAGQAASRTESKSVTPVDESTDTETDPVAADPVDETDADETDGDQAPADESEDTDADAGAGSDETVDEAVDETVDETVDEADDTSDEDALDEEPGEDSEKASDETDAEDSDDKDADDKDSGDSDSEAGDKGSSRSDSGAGDSGAEAA